MVDCDVTGHVGYQRARKSLVRARRGGEKMEDRNRTFETR